MILSIKLYLFQNQYLWGNLPADHQHRYKQANENHEPTPQDQIELYSTAETTLGSALNPAAHHNNSHGHNIMDRHLLTPPSHYYYTLSMLISSPQLWNLLPADIRLLYKEPQLFRKRLKTHYMQQSILHH